MSQARSMMPGNGRGIFCWPLDTGVINYYFLYDNYDMIL